MRTRPIRVIAGGVVALVLVGVGFYAGTTRAQAATTAGQILSVNADSITIQVRGRTAGGLAHDDVASSSSARRPEW